MSYGATVADAVHQADIYAGKNSKRCWDKKNPRAWCHRGIPMYPVSDISLRV
jgi:hypothetical protein